MKVILAAIFLVSACSFLNAQQPVWKELRSTEGGFSVLMPGTPIPNKVTVNTTSGVEEANMFSLSDESLNEYIVAYSKYQKTNPKEVSTGKLFDKVRDGILLVQQGKLLNEAAITLDGYSGRSIAVERPDGVITTARFYVVGDRFYQLSVNGKTNGREPEATNRFLDSFKLLR